jgi:hypothetical protein
VRTVSLLAALALVAAGCGDEAPGRPEPAAAVEWTRAADLPLAARYAPLLVWTGDDVLALGGHTGPACPPNASCVEQHDNVRDGAAYDPVADTWRALPDAPIDLDRFTGHALVDGTLVVGSDRGWWSFDLADEAWTRLPSPERGSSGPEAADDGRVYTHVRNRVQALEVATGAWTELPPDPLTPRLTDGTVFATDDGVVLTGVNYQETAPDEPTLAQADLWDGTAWRRLPRTGMIGPLYHWTGQRLVGAEIGGADGGQVNAWDRWYPFAGALDPRTGEWSELPGVPGYDDLDQRGWRVEAAAGQLIATAGFVYDDGRGTWTELGRPPSDIRQDVTGVWAGDRLVVVGGSDDGFEPVGEAWVWAP